MAETQYVLTITKQGKKEYIPLPTGGVAAHNQAWSTITDTPTTIAGYGITDAGSMEWPGAGIPLSTGASPWGTSYTTTGSGGVIALAASPVLSGTPKVSVGSSEYLRIAYTTLFNGGVTISNYYSDTYRNSAIHLGSSAADAGNISLMTSPDNATGLLKRFNITKDGYCGINDSAPYGIFTIKQISNDPARGILLYGSGGDDYLSIYSNNANVVFIQSADGSGYRTLALNASGGPVGVGTSTGLGALSVNGGVHVGGDSDAGDNNLLVDGEIRCVGDVIAAYTP